MIGFLGKTILLKKLDFSDWPFIPEKVKVVMSGHSLIVISDGIKYALNGCAVAKYNDIAEIWKDSVEIPGAKMSLGSVIEFSLRTLGGRKC